PRKGEGSTRAACGSFFRDCSYAGRNTASRALPVDRRGPCMSYSRMKGCGREQAVGILRSIEPRLGGKGMFSRAGRFAAVSAALLAFAAVQDAAAQQTVKIGAIYPLSGN